MFFFHAGDGVRGLVVTGVQTCALPISVKDGSGGRLCGLVNGSVVAGVLPAAQFCNGQTYSVLALPRLHNVTPFVIPTVRYRPENRALPPPAAPTSVL